MHRTDQSRWRHSHDYALDSSVAEQHTRIVIGITATMMVVEIAAGIAFNSMALLAFMSWQTPSLQWPRLLRWLLASSWGGPGSTRWWGIVGSAVVSVWAYGLVRDTSGILLDRTPESSDLPDEIRRAVESDGDSLVTDLHVWQIGAGKFAAIVSIVAHDPEPVENYRELFREHEELVHVTVEVQRCHEHEESHANA